jgi:hypothetical protein
VVVVVVVVVVVAAGRIVRHRRPSRGNPIPTG